MHFRIKLLTMTADGSGRVRRPFRMLLERDVAEIERRLALYRENCPKQIAEDLGVHPSTISAINLGRHPVQARMRQR
jgi:DNA-binding transcriptional ArsR family regulator